MSKFITITKVSTHNGINITEWVGPDFSYAQLVEMTSLQQGVLCSNAKAFYRSHGEMPILGWLSDIDKAEFEAARLAPVGTASQVTVTFFKDDSTAQLSFCWHENLIDYIEEVGRKHGKNVAQVLIDAFV